MILKKAISICFPLGLFLAFPCMPVQAKGLRAESPRVTVSVFNDVGISSELVKQAERVSSQVFEESGIQVDWVNCFESEDARGEQVACRLAAFPRHLHVRIVGRPLNLKDSILGISYLSPDGGGSQADIFYERIEKLQRDTFVPAAIILGHVVAHEIGHLLLGMNSHSPWGIMLAHWNKEELARANRGLLHFTEAQSHRMTERLSTAMAEEKCPSADVTDLPGAD